MPIKKSTIMKFGWPLFLLVGYLSSYFLLVDANIVSFDEDREYSYPFSVRFKKIVRGEGDWSVYGREESFLNWVYYPCYLILNRD